MKKSVKAMYFHAYWDGNFELKNAFVETCKALRIPFETVDCETELGVSLSCKYGVKLCPTVLIFEKGKEVYRGRGKDALLELQNHIKK